MFNVSQMFIVLIWILSIHYLNICLMKGSIAKLHFSSTICLILHDAAFHAQLLFYSNTKVLEHDLSNFKVLLRLCGCTTCQCATVPLTFTGPCACANTSRTTITRVKKGGFESTLPESLSSSVLSTSTHMQTLAHRGCHRWWSSSPGGGASQARMPRLLLVSRAQPRWRQWTDSAHPASVLSTRLLSRSWWAKLLLA